MSQQKITVTISENYTEDLRERLEELSISLGALAREMEVDRSQLARWFNTPMQPRIDNVLRMELAIVAIRARREKEKRRPNQPAGGRRKTQA